MEPPNPIASSHPPPTNFKSHSLPAGELSVDLYTIPSHSCWFSWDSIHDTERSELREFFDGSSFTRSPKVYKEYRDFIISKYREDPCRRLNFTEVRKSLVGDVCVLRKVFSFLDKWGLINFSVVEETVAERGEARVRVEEGAPIGVRVVGAPNSSKALVVPGGGGGEGGGGGVVYGFKLPPLASYSDAFGESERGKEVSCGGCKDKCDSQYYECTKEKYIVCLKCFEKGIYGENNSKDDFKLNDTGKINGSQGAVWTEAESLLLLESVLKHGDDWDLVAQNVQTKTKRECISRLIELPFGELMLGSHGKVSFRETIKEADTIQEQRDSSELQGTMKQDNDHQCEENGEQQEENYHHQEDNDEQQQKNDKQLETLEREKSMEIQSVEPPTKKKRVDSSDPNRSLIEQVALISTMVGPHITATAASAAVTVLSDGNPLVREIFYTEDDVSEYELRSGNLNNELERALQSEDADMEDAPHSSEIIKLPSVKESIPLALRMRAAVGTALGAAAAHAKLLADQEEREMEHFMAFIVETQVKKVQCKANYLDDLESLMEKEHALLDESKDSIVEERIETLRRIFASGIPRYTSQKTPTAGV